MIFKFTDNFIFFKKNPSILCRVQKLHYICIRNQAIRALSSAGSEHLVYTQRVGGSNPSAPTKEVQKNLFFILSTFPLEPSLPPFPYWNESSEISKHTFINILT